MYTFGCSSPQDTNYTHRCLQDYYEQGLSSDTIARAEVVAAHEKALMLDYGYPFEATSTGVTFLSPSTGFHKPLLGIWPTSSSSSNVGSDAPSYLAVVLAIMYEYFENGTRVFEEMERAALLWTSEGSGPIINGRHHAFAEKLVSDTPKEDCNGPGVYIQHSPEVGTQIVVEGVKIIYAGDAAAQEAHLLERCMVNVGQSECLHRRDRDYVRGQIVNPLHGSARLILADGKEVDTIQGWTRRVALGMDAETPKGRPVEPLFLRIYETIVNLECGSTRGEKGSSSGKRVWGLQKACFDCQAHNHKIDSRLASKILTWYYENCVQPGMKWERRTSAEGKNKAMWDALQAFVERELEDVNARRNVGMPEDSKFDAVTYSQWSVEAIIRLTLWFRGYSSLPPIPLTHWGRPENIPDLWLIKFDKNGKVSRDEESQALRAEGRAIQATRDKSESGGAVSTRRPAEKLKQGGEQSVKRKAEAADSDVENVSTSESQGGLRRHELRDRPGRKALAKFGRSLKKP